MTFNTVPHQKGPLLCVTFINRVYAITESIISKYISYIGVPLYVYLLTLILLLLVLKGAFGIRYLIFGV